MTGQIKMANMPSVAKSINFNNVQVKDIGQDKCTISFELENYEENTPVFITLNNMTRKEITTTMKKVDTHYEYVLDGLNSNSRYSFYLSAKSAKNEFLSNIYSFTTIKITVYGVRVDESQSNPANAVTYIEDAVGISPGNNTGLGGWADKFPFNQIKIVGFNNGQVTKELKKENKLQYIDGTSFNVNTNEDIMIQVPKVYWDVKTVTNGYEIRISDKKFNDTCDCYAHKVCGIEKDYNYIGAFGGWIGDSGKLRSLPNKALTVSKNIAAYRTAAEAKGKGYCQYNYYQGKLMTLLALISHKNLNTQASIGKGYTNGRTSLSNTGTTNTKGFIWGDQTGNYQMCYLGIEDFYGNALWFVDGIKTDSSLNVKAISDNYNFSNDSKYETLCKLTAQNGFLTKVMTDNKTLFLPKTVGGSNSTYYTDKCVTAAGNYISVFGGSRSNNLQSGAFSLLMNIGATSTATTRGSRLCYLGYPLEISAHILAVGNGEYKPTYIEINLYSDSEILEFYLIYNDKTINLKPYLKKDIYEYNYFKIRPEEFKNIIHNKSDVATIVVKNKYEKINKNCVIDRGHTEGTN